MTSSRALLLLVPALLLSGEVFATASPGYLQPPKEVLDVLHAPALPTAILSPTRERLALAQPVVHPPISDLAEPMLRLAGVRVNPRNNAPHGAQYWVALKVKTLPDGEEVVIALPEGARITAPRWNATGTLLAFTNMTETTVELWVADVATAKARRIPGLHVNAVMGSAIDWMPDQKTLLVRVLPEGRGAAPVPPSVPPGPRIEDSSGAGVASSTYEVRDVLRGPHDADLFDYHATAQVALVDAASGKVKRIGAPGVLASVSPAPGGQHLLVERIQRPYSYQRASHRFPREVEVWSPAGKLVATAASLPLADRVPIDGVPTGPRFHSWRPTEPATLVWAEALDGGDPKTKVPHRDRILLQRLGSEPTELCKLEHRFAGAQWIEGGGLVLVTEYDRDRKWRRTQLWDAEAPTTAPRLVWDMSTSERYANPGSPVQRVLPSGAWAVQRQGDWIYLDGAGSSPEGDRPFLDRMSLTTFASERLFRCGDTSYEGFMAWVDAEAGTFITRHESPADPPNYFLRTLTGQLEEEPAKGEATWASSSRAITSFPDPAPQLRAIKKQRVTYQRADGVPLSFTLYLPPGYEPGTPLPTVFWAYPLDYAEKGVAGQITGSTTVFTTIGGTSPLFFLLQGYAVLDEVAMPVVGPPETAYDTFIEQTLANATAAIDEAVKMGVTDRDRIGVGGHSHGALMTANLLAHSDLFRAGIARSGAHNHTVRPFGFQNEKRTLWEARDTYVRLSPVLNANLINEPLLLIHGEVDPNPGTVPQQSEKLFESLRGLGATARLVMLPHEGHGYSARESKEHVLHEMLSWFDRHVKNAPPRPQETRTAAR